MNFLKGTTARIHNPEGAKYIKQIRGINSSRVRESMTIPKLSRAFLATLEGAFAAYENDDAALPELRDDTIDKVEKELEKQMEETPADDNSSDDDDDSEPDLKTVEAFQIDEMDLDTRFSNITINDKLVKKVETLYNTKLPDEIKKVISAHPKTKYHSARSMLRGLSIDEILNASENLGVDFIDEGVIPLFDIGDGDYVVYDINAKKWYKFDTEEAGRFD